MNLIVDNILDMIQVGGEMELSEDLSAFSCPKNPEIESFLKKNAIDFAKKKMSITYVVSDETDGEILGYFTLAHKALEIEDVKLTQTVRRKISRFAQKDEEHQSYTVSAFLLAQFGKNYAVDNGKRITGRELMEQVDDVIADIQHRIGGGVMYLDVEERPGLIKFYEDAANYKAFNERFSKADGIKYQQMIRYI